MYGLVAVLLYDMIDNSYPKNTCISLSNQDYPNESGMFLKTFLNENLLYERESLNNCETNCINFTVSVHPAGM